MTVFRAVKAWIENEKGELLFLKEKTPSGKDYYSLPGGRVNEGETEEKALEREVNEETGLDVAVGKHLGEYHFTMESGDVVEAEVFKCEITGGSVTKEFQDSLQEEIVSFHWISPKEFIEKNLTSSGLDFNRFLEGITSGK